MSSYNHALGAQTTLSNQSVSEVGVFSIIATPPVGSYFTETVSATVSGLVGRFAPAFLQASGEAALTPSCGSAFSYQGQPMAFASGQDPRLTVTAFNRQNVVTGNYDGVTSGVSVCPGGMTIFRSPARPAWIPRVACRPRAR